jgi:hypothetical protein
MCHGFRNGGCDNEAVLGRIYCLVCQDRVTANGAAVQKCHLKQAERSKNIHVSEPFFKQLAGLSITEIKDQLPASCFDKLSHEGVGVDTSAWKRSCQAMHMYSIGAAYLDSQGQRKTFWTNRHGNDIGWMSATH